MTTNPQDAQRRSLTDILGGMPMGIGDSYTRSTPPTPGITLPQPLVYTLLDQDPTPSEPIQIDPQLLCSEKASRAELTGDIGAYVSAIESYQKFLNGFREVPADESLQADYIQDKSKHLVDLAKLYLGIANKIEDKEQSIGFYDAGINILNLIAEPISRDPIVNQLLSQVPDLKQEILARLAYGYSRKADKLLERKEGVEQNIDDVDAARALYKQAEILYEVAQKMELSPYYVGFVSQGLKDVRKALKETIPRSTSQTEAPSEDSGVLNLLRRLKRSR